MVQSVAGVDNKGVNGFGYGIIIFIKAGVLGVGFMNRHVAFKVFSLTSFHISF